MSFRIFLKYKYTQKYKDFTGLSKIIIFADPDGTTFCGMKHGNVKIEKTNAARLLDRAKIAYELIPYRVDEEHLAATHVAEQLGEDVAAVFKTLVLRGDRTGHFVCVVPGDHEVDLKVAARISGNKKADLIPVRELLPTTGYIRGGCSPIGMKKPFPTFFHISVLQHSVIYISAGVRGLQIRIAPICFASSGAKRPKSAVRRLWRRNKIRNSFLLFDPFLRVGGIVVLSKRPPDRYFGNDSLFLFGCRSGFALECRKGDAVPYRQNPNEDHRAGGDELRGGRRQVEIHTEIVDQSAADAGDGVDVFAENKGYFVQQHVAQHTARRTGQRTHDDTHPHRIADGYAFLNADDGEKSQSDGIENEEGVVEPDHVFAQPDYEQEGESRYDQVGNVLHPERGQAQQQVAQRTAADGRDESDHIGSEPVEMFGRSEPDAADGECEGTDIVEKGDEIHDVSIFRPQR